MEERSHQLPFLNIQLPFPAYDLLVPVITVAPCSCQQRPYFTDCSLRLSCEPVENTETEKLEKNDTNFSAASASTTILHSHLLHRSILFVEGKALLVRA